MTAGSGCARRVVTRGALTGALAFWVLCALALILTVPVSAFTPPSESAVLNGARTTDIPFTNGSGTPLTVMLTLDQCQVTGDAGGARVQAGVHGDPSPARSLDELCGGAVLFAARLAPGVSTAIRVHVNPAGVTADWSAVATLTGYTELPDDYLADARAALDTVGGAGVELRFDACAATAAACASPEGWVGVNPHTAVGPSETLAWVMAHEYAHLIQFDSWSEMTADRDFGMLFEGDAEWLADCMAMAHLGYQFTSGYGYECSDAQLTWAGDFWHRAVS